MRRLKYLIVAGGGSGTRMGSSVPKQFLDLGGVPVLQRTISAFVSAVPDIKVITVLPYDQMDFWRKHCLTTDFDCPQILVKGGITRFHSVRNALEKVPGDAIVAIHDAVRPLLSKQLIVNMFAQMESNSVRALVPVLPTVDTLKVLDRDGENLVTSGETVDRSRIFGAQTPQMFFGGDIKEAYSQAFDTAFTDDASVAQKNGIPLSYCQGERYNFKITTPEDLSLASLIVSAF